MYDEDIWKEQTIKLKFNKIIEKNLEKSFLKAVKKRVPKEKYGLLLSGGVDSQTIAFVCKKINSNFKDIDRFFNCF